MANERDALGLEGEKLAEKELRRRGMRIVARRYRVTAGELDLVCAQRRTIVFVEVKTQSDRKHVDPEQRLTSTKRRRMIRAAKCFVLERNLTDRPCRFDVVTVTFDAEKRPQLEYFPDAFLPDRW
jgi:putative endonuclease